MESVVSLLGISGSLREKSLNTSLLAMARDALRPSASLDIVGLAGIPLYDQDVEQELGIPDSVKVLKERIAAADGLILATPEYNNGMPGVMKNAVDWLSRPPADIPKIFSGKPTALCGASLGPAGTALAQAQWLPVLHRLGVRLWSGERLMVAHAHLAFGAIDTDPPDDLKARISAFINGFADFIERPADKR